MNRMKHPRVRVYRQPWALGYVRITRLELGLALFCALMVGALGL